MSGFMNTIREKLSVNTNKIRNRADVNQQYKDSEFREKNYKKTPHVGATEQSLNIRRKSLKSLTGD